MHLAPFFHNTGSCADSICDTDRFMAFLHSTQLCCWLWHVYTQRCVNVRVLYSTSYLQVCIHMHLCLWMHPLWTMHVFVCEKRPYGLQNVLADDSSSGFEIVQSGILCNRKGEMKNKGKKRLTVKFTYLLLKLQDQARLLSAGRIYLIVILNRTTRTHIHTNLYKSARCSYKPDSE